MIQPRQRFQGGTSERTEFRIARFNSQIDPSQSRQRQERETISLRKERRDGTLQSRRENCSFTCMGHHK
ncbi:MAG: hypothetical protein EZS28_039453 [Streblomastix strix]|uniref:IBB domain-containing protein n=1 Tax=Streblomastix strix TaxID=222440 RepID=A0A5J4U4E8_9EUKA|nr:MAG: hypothetical protein EZS28_039453 [Streblomastix strix]